MKSMGTTMKKSPNNDSPRVTNGTPSPSIRTSLSESSDMVGHCKSTLATTDASFCFCIESQNVVATEKKSSRNSQ
jgi:hypothetical protein